MTLHLGHRIPYYRYTLKKKARSRFYTTGPRTIDYDSRRVGRGTRALTSTGGRPIRTLPLPTTLFCSERSNQANHGVSTRRTCDLCGSIHVRLPAEAQEDFGD